MKHLYPLFCVFFLFGCLDHNDSQEMVFANEFVNIKGGTFTLGYKNHHVNPEHQAVISDFEISSKEVTNTQWKVFVDETGYITTAEKLKNAMTFYPGLGEYKWVRDSTANWRCPFGLSQDGIEHKMDHPVTCISFEDILEYCAWKGVRLPTLDEWEVACRAGSSGLQFFDKKEAIYEFGNIWKGTDHMAVHKDERFVYTSPVASFKPNAFGLYDMYGNVFEFCSDTKPHFPGRNNVCARGGSWWCSMNACNFFNSVDIGSVNRLASFSNHGFRVVKRD